MSATASLIILHMQLRMPQRRQCFRLGLQRQTFSPQRRQPLRFFLRSIVSPTLHDMNQSLLYTSAHINWRGTNISHQGKTEK